MAEGLFHPNCTHRMVAVPEVVAKEYYTPDGKEKDKKDVAWEQHLAHQEKRKAQRKQAKKNREEMKTTEKKYSGQYAEWKGGKSIEAFIHPYPDRTYAGKDHKAADRRSVSGKKNSKGYSNDIIPPEKMVNILGNGVKITPLTENEKKIVSSYTSGDSDEINSFLNNKDKASLKEISKNMPIIKRIRTAIEKCILTTEQTVWRGSWEDDISDILQGNAFTSRKGFLSCSTDKEVARRYARNYPNQSVLYKVTVPEGSHAMPINDVAGSAYPAEQEVLLKNNGVLEITKKPYKLLENGKKTDILVVEVIYHEC